MCGIFGIRRFDGQPVDVDLLRRMTSLLSHRGPDGDGYLVRGSVGFGHRRLSIVDLDGSAQPMSAADGSLHVCFNGEILNYRELRDVTPYRYRTAGDTEVLLATFAREREHSVRGLEGQFAYALYDETRDELWLFRDRLGILPLYYYVDRHMLAFASEIKALLPVLPAAPDVDRESIREYLVGRSVSAPRTLFTGIRKFPPATMMKVTGDGRCVQSPYWDLPDIELDPRELPVDVAVEQLESRLAAAVARNLVADVPVGAFLSGGIDSSIIVALMQRAGATEVETFAAGFGDERFDELPWARAVSDMLGTRHHEVHVTADDFTRLWPHLTWHRDAPVSQSSDVAVHQLARLARTRVRVALSGEGSDELFAGYPKHRFAAATMRAGIVPQPVRRAALAAADRSLPAGGGRVRTAVRALSGRTTAERLDGWFASFTPVEVDRYLGPVPSRDVGRGENALRVMLARDVHGWLTDNLLERADRMAMAVSLETRPPFLDRELVEFALTMPSSYKIRGGVGKWPLRQVARKLLPPQVVQRPKVGFKVPLDAWFRAGLRPVVERLASTDSFAATLVPRAELTAMMQAHFDGRRNEESRLWALVSLEVWHDVFFKGRDVSVRDA